MRKLFIPLIILLLIALSFYALSSKNGAGNKNKTVTQVPKLTKIRFAIWSGMTFINTTPWIAMDEGIFKKNGLDVEFVSVGNVNTALADNSADTAISGITSGLPAAIAGAKIKLIANLFKNAPFVVITNKNDKNQIRTVGVAQQGSVFIAPILKVFEIAGVNKNNLTFITVGNQEAQLLSLAKGGIDAAGMAAGDFDSLSLKLADNLKDKNIHVLYDLADSNNSYIPYSILVNQNLITQNRKAIESLIKSIEDTNKFIKENENEAIRIYAKRAGLDSKTAKPAIDTYIKALKGNYISPPDKNAALDFINILSEQNPKAKEYDVNNFFDTSFVK